MSKNPLEELSEIEQKIRRNGFNPLPELGHTCIPIPSLNHMNWRIAEELQEIHERLANKIYALENGV